MTDAHQNTEEIQPAFGIIHHIYTAWVVLAVGLILTASIWHMTEQNVREHAESKFTESVRKIQTAVHNRMIGYEQVLWGSVGFFNASQHVDRNEFYTYISSLNIEKNWPGIQGIGFAVPVSVGEKAKHIHDIRNEGFPEYTIKPEGDRDEYSAIIYLEPFDWRNERAFGYDMWSNDIRREAMTRARDTGEASISGTITLVQETDSNVQKGFLMYLPLYQNGASVQTVEQRRKAFVGWVYSPFRMGDLMAGILGQDGAEIEFEVFDGGSMTMASMLFDSNNNPHIHAAPTEVEFMRTVAINIQGRKWTLNFHSDKSTWIASEFDQPLLVVIVGIVTSILLFYIVFSFSLLQKRAQEIARNMTRALVIANNDIEFQKLALDEHAIVSIADAKGNITYVNDKFCEISGYSLEELLGQNHRIIKSDKHPQELYEDLWKAISSGKTWHGEIKNKKKRGGHYWVDTTIVPFVNEKGVPFQYVSIRNDITDRKHGVKALETALTDAQQANQVKSAFLASMSHELRTPLNAILGFSDILSGQYFGPPGEGKYREYATDIHSSGEHLLELINDLLDISSIEAGKTTLHREQLTIEDIVEDCKRTIAQKAIVKDIAIVTPVGVHATLYADKRAIKQILLNLLSNAIKFTPNGGKVTVTAEGAKQTTRIVVSDTGRGIAPEQLPDITSPFTKSLDNPHVTEQGWGLGLAISKSLVELHGGVMTIESEVGKGTSVSIEIPSHSSETS
jgi:PAS domain S-box-containing protein